jgi:protein-disulfide isomerase
MSEQRKFAGIRVYAGLWALLIAVSGPLAAQGGGAAGKTLATVDGAVITEEQVRKQAAVDMEKLDMQQLQLLAELGRNRHQLIEGNLNRLIEEKLLDAEAASRKVSREELMKTEVEGKMQQPTKADVDKFYEENRQQIPMPKEQVAGQILEYLGEQRSRAAYDSFITTLKDKYKVQTFLEPLRTTVEVKDHPSKGSAQAPVTIVEFSDFECPYCSKLTATLQEVEKNYGDKVRIVFRQFPLANHPNAPKAAEASLCANDQSQFWAMHDLLFQEPKQLEIDAIKAKAVSLKLDADKFNGCLDSGRYAERVKADRREGATVGVSGTPAMFINGRFISGAVPYADLAKILDDEIARAKP